MTLDVNTGTVVVGVLTEAVGEWAFTGVDTSGPKATTMTLIIDSDSLLGYAETCSVNGGSPFGVRWGGGIAPLPITTRILLVSQLQPTLMVNKSLRFIYSTSILIRYAYFIWCCQNIPFW